jgi:glycosyltransferase involved in cell wall biosynthesis
MSSFRPKVSIVIPVYNGADYVAQAIESALDQTYPNIEVLVINDGSNDDEATANIARSFGQRIRYFEKANGGVATALNLGIEEATGDYISWLSHDDLYLPHKVATQIEFLRELDNREVVLYSDYHLIDEKSRVLSTVRLDHQSLSRTPLYSVLRGSIHGCSTLVPSQAFETFGGFDTDLATTQDYALWFRMARQIPFIHLPNPLICSRWHPAQGSKTHPHVLREANALWIGFADALSQEEMLSCEPTVYRFLREMAEFLAHSPYREAQADIAARAEAERKKVFADLERYKVSVIVWPGPHDIDLHEALSSALKQSHQNLELLILANPAWTDIPALHANYGDHRIRMVETSAENRASARNLGLDAATGDYVAFLQPNSLWMPDKIALQLLECVLQGAVVSYTDFQTVDETGRVSKAISASDCDSLRKLGQSDAICAATVMIECKVLREEENLRFRHDLELAEEACFWLDLSKKGEFLHLAKPLTQVTQAPNQEAAGHKRSAARRLNIVAHLGKGNALLENPLEASELLFATYRDLRSLAADRLLEQTASGRPLWPKAPIVSQLAGRLGKVYSSLPVFARRVLQAPVRGLLLGLERQSTREGAVRERLRRPAR